MGRGECKAEHQPATGGSRSLASSLLVLSAPLCLVLGITTACSQGGSEQGDLVRVLDLHPIKASRETGEDNRKREKVSLHKSLRDAWSVPGVSEISVEVDTWKRDVLFVSLGVQRADSTSRGSAATVDFEISLEGEGECDVPILSDSIRLRPGQVASRWSDYDLPLRECRGRRSRLVLRQRAEASVLALWGNPIVFSRAQSGRNVVFISIDTLGQRYIDDAPADSLPTFREFGREAAVFANARSHQTWTLTSHASMLTSLYPDSHRATKRTPIAENFPLLPELLKREGYFVVGLVNNPYLNPFYGYERGYDWYDFDHDRRSGRGRVKRTFSESTESLLELLERRTPRPTFIFFHVIDPHSDWRETPYESPWEHEAGDLTALNDSVAKLRATRLLQAANRGEVHIDARDTATIRSQYQASIRHVDGELSGLLAGLDEIGIRRSAIVLITSDHGEEFKQHGKFLHVQPYEESIRVPLMIQFPGGKYSDVTIEEDVQLVDIVPTILEGLGKPPLEESDGESLIPLLEGRAGYNARPVISKGGNDSLTPNDVYAVIVDGKKLIWHVRSGRTQLYDLSADPEETVDLTESMPATRESMLALLQHHRSERMDGFRVRVPWFQSDREIQLSFLSREPLRRVRPLGLSSDSDEGISFHLAEEGRLAILTFDSVQRGVEGEDPKPAIVGMDFDLAETVDEVEVRVIVEGSNELDVNLHVPSGTRYAEFPIRIRRGRELVRDENEWKKGIRRSSDVFVIYAWEFREAGKEALIIPEDVKRDLEALGYVPN